MRTSLAQTAAVAFILGSTLTQPASADDKPSNLYADYTAENFRACLWAISPASNVLDPTGINSFQLSGTAAGLNCKLDIISPKFSRVLHEAQTCHFQKILDGKHDFPTLDVDGGNVTVFYESERSPGYVAIVFNAANEITDSTMNDGTGARGFSVANVPGFVLNAVNAARGACPPNTPRI